MTTTQILFIRHGETPWNRIKRIQGHIDIALAETGVEQAARLAERLAPIVAAHPGGRIAVVTHGGVLDCVYRHAASLPLDAPRQYALLNTSINVVEADGDALRIVRWADVDHLGGGSDDDGYRKVL